MSFVIAPLTDTAISSGMGSSSSRRRGDPLRRVAEKTELGVQTALKMKNRPGLRKIASTLGVGVGTVQRISRELAAA
jgi:hypothetical protein